MGKGQSDAMLTALAERCKERGLEPKCTKCGRTLAAIRQSGEGLPVLMMAEGLMCAACRVGREIATVVPAGGIRTIPTATRSGAPLVTLSKSGAMGLNRALCDLYEFPEQGYLVLGWDPERGRLLFGLGAEGDGCARKYRRKDGGNITINVKSALTTFCRLDFATVQAGAPWPPEYDEETGLLAVQIG